ncbi:MAG: cupin domain-containing protein [Candidatus Aminicenantaceae bacterium]
MKNPIITKTSILFSAVCLLAFSLLIGCEVQQSDEKLPAVNEHPEDMGEKPWVLDIEEATITNQNYRMASWSGKYIQMVLMSLKPGEKIDLELHENHDQFIRIERGEARVLMGETKDNLTFDKKVSDDWTVFIPAGYWHQVQNIGDTDLKIYTIYGPPEHPAGTVHKTYEDAEDHHHDH